MMQKGQIDAAWTVEPWVSRLEQEASGKVFLEERDLWPAGRYTTALLVVRRAFLAANPGAVDRLVAAHVAATLALRADPDGNAELLSREIGAETKKALPLPIVRSSFRRIELTWDPLLATLEKAAADAHAVGFLSEKPSLDGIFEPGPLDRALRAAGQPALPGREPGR
jgi:NitT/TauT family transport system substrate-binding protein